VLSLRLHDFCIIYLLVAFHFERSKQSVEEIRISSKEMISDEN